MRFTSPTGARRTALRIVVFVLSLALFGGAQTLAWAVANASLSPTSKDFGTVGVGSSSAAQVFTITNTGNTNLNIQEVVLSGANADQFSLDTAGMASAVSAGNSTTFSVAFSPTSGGAKSASVDVSTNANDPSAALTGTGGDTTPPTVSLTSAAPEPTDTSPIPVTVTFSESVTGFVAGDVSVTNGSVANLAGSGADYTFDLVPTAAGQVTASVPADSATDGGGNGNTASNTLSRTYAPVVPNTPPTISDIADQTIDEDTDTGALAFIVGDAETAAGSLAVSGASDDTSLVPNGNIAFGGSGADRTVTVTPTADRSGSATITVTVSDGTLDATDTFVVTVDAVNDPPSFTKGADQTVPQDAGAQSVVGWATAISAGPADESGQALTFDVSNDDPALFSAQPAVSPTGTLTYTPAPGASGSATVTVTLSDDGGTANGGDDTSAPHTFTITVTPGPVNAPPVAGDDAASTSVDTPIASIDVLSNDTDADGDPLSIGAFDAASAQGGTVACAATCSYAPPAGFSGTDTFGYEADDGNGGTDGATVTIQVQAPAENQPPSLTVAPAAQTVQHSDLIAPVSIDATDPEGGAVTLEVVGLPDGVSFTDDGNGHGTLHGPALAEPGTYAVHVTARDGAGGQATATARISVVGEDVLVRYTGQHLVFTQPGSLGRDVVLRARLTDSSAQTDAPSGLRRPSPLSDLTAADVSGSTVTFMKGDVVLCGPVAVRLADPADPTAGIATCGATVYLPLGSHDIDVHVDGTHAFSGRIGQVEVDRATLNYVAGGGTVVPWSSAGELAAEDGSTVAFGFRVRYNPTRTKVLGHANVLFVSGGTTYQLRSRAIDAIVSGPGRAFARFETTVTLSDVTEPLGPGAVETGLRLVVWVADRSKGSDQIAIAAYRGSALVFASRWNGGPVLRNLGAGRIVIR
jgi:hypothetical protein